MAYLAISLPVVVPVIIIICWVAALCIHRSWVFRGNFYLVTSGILVFPLLLSVGTLAIGRQIAISAESHGSALVANAVLVLFSCFTGLLTTGLMHFLSGFIPQGEKQASA
ncbi:putative membrane protein [Cryobacterium sp. MP_M5]|nr:putative membrane protein [Cryobacterium sp. MP_M3]MEC5178498.1 putative membrane protein [Cryobacterium sp. MP_M5]